MVEPIAPGRVGIVADDRQAFGVCWHVADRKRWALVAAELGVNFWYFSVFVERRTSDFHTMILA